MEVGHDSAPLFPSVDSEAGWDTLTGRVGLPRDLMMMTMGMHEDSCIQLASSFLGSYILNKKY